MGQVTVFTKARSIAIENGTITFGSVVNGRLILTRKDGTTIDAGAVKGDVGPIGLTGLGLTPVELANTVSLNNQKTTGIFTQTSNTNATLANAYPVAYAGLLEVYTNPAANITWQHYTVYNGGPYASTLWIRSTNTTGTWTNWVCANPPKLSAKSSCDTTLALTTTQTDLSGTSLTITVLSSSDVYAVSANADIQSTGTTATTGVVRLVVDGATQTEQAFWSNGAISGLRGMATQEWLVTGLSVGDHVFKLAAARSGGADAMVRVNSVHTTLFITRI